MTKNLSSVLFLQVTLQLWLNSKRLIAIHADIASNLSHAAELKWKSQQELCERQDSDGADQILVCMGLGRRCAALTKVCLRKRSSILSQGRRAQVR